MKQQLPVLVRSAILAGGEVDGAVRELFREYWSSFGFTPCFQDFAAEVATLPGRYAPPDGGLALAEVDGHVAGCVAFRRFDNTRCEMKRLYVRPDYRGLGAASKLLEWLFQEALRAGYRDVVADTLPAMDRAISLYERYGFERTGAYMSDPAPGAIFLRKRLPT